MKKTVNFLAKHRFASTMIAMFILCGVAFIEAQTGFIEKFVHLCTTFIEMQIGFVKAFIEMQISLVQKIDAVTPSELKKAIPITIVGIVTVWKWSSREVEKSEARKAQEKINAKKKQPTKDPYVQRMENQSKKYGTAPKQPTNGKVKKDTGKLFQVNKN